MNFLLTYCCRSVEKLKNLLLATQSQVAQREKENLKPIKSGTDSPRTLSSSATKVKKSIVKDSGAPPTDNGKNHLLKSLATAKDTQIAFSSALNETIAAHSHSSPAFLSPQHHSTLVKPHISAKPRSARVLEDQPLGHKLEDPSLASSTSLVKEDVVIGEEDPTDADETAESSENTVHLLTSSSSKTDGKVVAESTKALEMAFHHFNHLQTLFQEMSMKMTTEKQGVHEENETDIVSTIL